MLNYQKTVLTTSKQLESMSILQRLRAVKLRLHGNAVDFEFQSLADVSQYLNVLANSIDDPCRDCHLQAWR
jgi:hypothetical protein